MFTRRAGILIALFIAVPLIVMASGQEKKATKATPAAKNPVATLETTMGTIEIELYADKAPITVNNFISYATVGFYNGTIIHRVDANVIQGGGYTADLTARPTLRPIQSESKNGLKNLRGTIAMARYDDPNSATSQFFINLTDNPHLDRTASDAGYAVFGKVTKGMDVVDKIGKVKTAPKGVFATLPVQTVVVQTVKVVQ
ncbi:MAG: peptidylprolyl isomerase [Acidobacteriota bacterium]